MPRATPTVRDATVETAAAYLALARLPALAPLVLAPGAAFLWSGDGRRVLWCNAAGAAWFGTDIAGLLAAAPVSETEARMLARIARNLPADTTRLEALRLGAGLRAAAQPFACRRVALADGGRALLAAVPGGAAEPLPLAAERLARALAGLGPAVTVTGPGGRLLAGEPAEGEADSAEITTPAGPVVIAIARWPAEPEEVAEAAPAEVASPEVASPEVAQAEQVVAAAEPSPAEVPAPEPAPPLAPPLPEIRAIAFETEAMGSELVWVARVELATAPPPPAGEHLAVPAPEPPPAIPAEAEPAGAAAMPEPAAAGPGSEPIAESPPAEPATDTLPAEAFLAGPLASPVAGAEPALPLTPAPEPAAVEEPPAAAEAPAEPPAEEAELAAEPAASAPEPPLPAAPPRVRFVFQMDADGRFTFVSPEFAGVVGAAADVVGMGWDEAAARFGIGNAGAVAAALAGRDTWSGVSVAWPAPEARLLVPVDLAALPAFSRDRRFEGYRGFGVCRVADAVAAPAAEPAAERVPSAVPEPEPAAAPEPAAQPAPAPASNVVRLPAKHVASDRNLSAPEEDAFRRIAEALGASMAERGAAAAAAEMPADIPALPVAGLADAGPEAEPPAPAPEPAAAVPDPRLLERIPLAVLVFRDAQPLYANRRFLELTGHASLAALAAAGGLGALFDGGERPGEAGWQPDSQGRRMLRRADGAVLAAEARLNATPWGAGSALLLSLREAPAEPPPAPPARDPEAAAELERIAGRVAELEAILDTATDGVFVIDSSGRIVSLNDSAEALFGVEAADVRGTPFVGLLAEESHKAALDYLDGLAANGVASVLNDGREVIGRVPTGGLMPLFMTMGRIAGTGKFCAVMRDITQWKNAEEELLGARRAAEAANAQKSEFLAKISHEIRTPLNAIIGFCEVMIEERFGPVGNPRYQEYLRDIHNSGAHLMSLINDLLDLSKIEAGKLDLAFEAVAVNELILECVALMQPQANRERIIIRTSLPAAIPQVVADPRSLRQILLNLLSNAVKFTPAGGQVIVSTALEESGDVTIRVRDTGHGMSERDIEQALKPFRQLATSGRSRGDGTGLGLPLTKALVEANRAAFAIESAVNQGTLIRITFPTTRVLAG